MGINMQDLAYDIRVALGIINQICLFKCVNILTDKIIGNQRVFKWFEYVSEITYQ